MEALKQFDRRKSILFAHPQLSWYLSARFLTLLAIEMQSVALGWQVYEITKRPLALGYIGLFQFLPGLVLFPICGYLADTISRRKLLLICYASFSLCSGGLLVLAWSHVTGVALIYVVTLFIGIVRSLYSVSVQAIVPQLVPDNELGRAVAVNAGMRQTANLLGPLLGGLLYAVFAGSPAVYGTATLASALAIAPTLRLRRGTISNSEMPAKLRHSFAGFQYLAQNKLLLGAMTLDLFAVLLGGAVALLPVYAHDILNSGPWGLGLLRSAPAVGAAIMSVVLVFRTIRKRAGTMMLWGVAAFGIFTVVFGVSRSFSLSIVALVLLGASDMVSVVVRTTLIQVSPPDDIRGRVNAVNSVFVGASNELGQFESGLTAQWFGPIPAVVAGGLATIGVVLVWAWRFPQLKSAEF